MKFNARILNLDGTYFEKTLKCERVAVLGFTSRNKELLEKHKSELGIGNAEKVDLYPRVYWIDPTRLTPNGEIFVVGNNTSGEVEYFALFDNGEFYITVGSDHTDRELEKISIHKSKQVCNKVISNEFWKYSDVYGHFDKLILESYVFNTAGAKLYQRGKVGDILEFEELSKIAKNNCTDCERLCFFSGTVPTINGKFEFAERWKMVLIDPVLNRKIEQTYTVHVIPEKIF